jgi:hypothetical protein
MKRVFLLIVLPTLLVALGFAQTPAASRNTDQINIKGCLGGSDSNYTVAEDTTGQIFKITSSSADLKPHVGHDVKLIGQKAGAAENSVAVTELNMISEVCTAAAAAPAATVSTLSETVGTPPAAAAPTAAAPAATVSAPSETVTASPAAAAPAVAPAPTSSTTAETVITPPAAATPTPALAATVSTPPPAAAAEPAVAVSTPAESASAPAASAVHQTRPSARPRSPAATPAAAPTPAEPVSTPVADAAVPTAPVGPPSETATTPAAPAAKTSAGRSAGMFVSIVVLVLLIGGGVPLYNRWRKRRLLEQTRGQNLSFTKEAKSDPGKSDPTEGRKAA